MKNSNRTLYYLGLESYSSRYTAQLESWNKEVFDILGIDYKVVPGQTLGSDQQIVTGSVLDAHGRSYYSLTQMSEFVKLMQQGKITADDVVLLEDMFTPGVESLPYIMDQTPAEYRPKIYVRCWAQSPDPDDFINREGMLDWMRNYELMLDKFIDGIFIASEEFAAYIRVCGIKAPLYVVGLPFSKKEVQNRIPDRPKLIEKVDRVVFASRWDDEKQPDFYMDVAKYYHKHIDKSVEFAILTGRNTLTGSNPEAVARAIDLTDSDDVNFKIYTNLQKNEYYGLLSNSKVMFNCALQDWVSFTAIEGDSLGTMTVYPAYRSFPETFNNNPDHMYIPWSVADAAKKIKHVMDEIKRGNEFDIGQLSDYHDATVHRMVYTMFDEPNTDGTLKKEKWERLVEDTFYRRYATKNKYDTDPSEDKN